MIDARPWLSVACCVAVVSSAGAQPSTDRDLPVVRPTPAVVYGKVRPRIALIVPQTPTGAAQSDRLVTAIKAQLSDLPATLVWSKVPALPAALAEQIALASQLAQRENARSVFWFDLAQPGQLLIYLAEPGGGRVLARTVETANAAERIEAAGVIVRGLTRAIASGGQIGVNVPPPPPQAKPPTSKPVAPRPAPAPTPPPRQAPPPRLSLGMSYASDAPGSDTLSYGLGLGVGYRLNQAWSLYFGYRVVSTAETTHDLAALSLDRYPFELGAQHRFSWGRWSLAGGVALGLEVIAPEATTSSAAFRSADASSEIWWSLGASATGRWALTPALTFFATAAADVLLDRPRFVVEAPTRRVVVIELWRARPRLLLGIEVGVL